MIGGSRHTCICKHGSSPSCWKQGMEKQLLDPTGDSLASVLNCPLLAPIRDWPVARKKLFYKLGMEEHRKVSPLDLLFLNGKQRAAYGKAQEARIFGFAWTASGTLALSKSHNITLISS